MTSRYFYTLSPFIARSSFTANPTATAAAAPSAIGPAYITPSIPINTGKIRMSGSKKITCLVSDTTMPSYAFPIDVKKTEHIGCIPLINVISIKILKYRSAK